MGAAAVRDAGAEEVQRAQASEGGEVAQACVADPAGVQAQLLQRRQQRQLLQPDVADAWVRKQYIRTVCFGLSYFVKFQFDGNNKLGKNLPWIQKTKEQTKSFSASTLSALWVWGRRAGVGEVQAAQLLEARQVGQARIAHGARICQVQLPQRPQLGQARQAPA